VGYKKLSKFIVPIPVRNPWQVYSPYPSEKPLLERVLLKRLRTFLDVEHEQL